MNKTIVLLPPSAFGAERSIHQSIEGYYGDVVYSLEAFVQAGREEITMIALTPFGSGLYEIIFTQGTIAFRSGMTPAGVKPEYLMADFQLCYFPDTVVREWVEKAGLRFTEIPVAGGWRRMIAEGDRPVIDIRRRGNEIVMTNHWRHYGYTIRELME